MNGCPDQPFSSHFNFWDLLMNNPNGADPPAPAGDTLNHWLVQSLLQPKLLARHISCTSKLTSCCVVWLQCVVTLANHVLLLLTTSNNVAATCCATLWIQYAKVSTARCKPWSKSAGRGWRTSLDVFGGM